MVRKIKKSEASVSTPTMMETPAAIGSESCQSVRDLGYAPSASYWPLPTGDVDFTCQLGVTTQKAKDYPPPVYYSFYV